MDAVDFAIVIAFIAASTPALYAVWMSMKSLTLGKRLVNKA